MAHILEDRILESSTTTGTGAFALGGAVTGFRTFSSVCAVGDTVPYYIEALDSVGQPTGEYEYGIGTYSAADELTRTTVEGSSNAGSPVNFAAGDKNVAITITKAELQRQIDDNITESFVLRGHLAGLGLSTAGSSATFSVAAGEATDKDNTSIMRLASAISKTISAWAVGTGNGALDTGAIANNTWYHVHLIGRTDLTVRDVLVSLSATAPTMPAGYTYSRRIGSMRTNGSAQWTKFVQDGDLFQWDAPVQDVSANNPGSAAVTRTLTVPTGVHVRAVLNVVLTAGSSGDGVYLSDLDVSDQAASSTVSPGYMIGSVSTSNAGQVAVRTNTSAQIRTRNVNGTAAETLRISTVGWHDRRGRDD